MALWKETGSNPSPTASGAPAAASSSTVTELHGKSADRAPETHTTTTVDTTRRAPTRAPGAESVIAAELAIEGKIVGGGDVRIAGRFKGDVQVDGNVSLDSGARLEGHVKASVVSVGGELIGNIENAKRVELLETGVINGDVKAGSLTVAAGSRMRGQVEFGYDLEGRSKTDTKGFGNA